MISMVKVPGVSVIELARINLPNLDFRDVFALITPGLIGSEGLNTILAMSKFALINSQKKVPRKKKE